MKKLITCCCFACLFTGCILVSSEKKELSKESLPPHSVVAVKPAGPVGRMPVKEPPKTELFINISARNENNSISDYRWAEIYLDDNFIGSTHNTQLNLEPGQHKIAVKAPGYKSYEKIITILPLSGRTVQQLNILLEKE